ncbi:MAG: hypothetical protein ACM3NO_00130 [Deltaproteobacteria bacterium]
MSFLDFLTGKINCPRCGASGAKEEYGQIRCPNPSCAYYAGAAAAGSGSAPKGRSAFDRAAGQFTRGGFSPEKTVTIRYRNFKGEEKEFLADAESARRMAKRVSIRVAPKGVRISLARERISNWSEVDGALSHRVEPGQNPPTPRERQVLAFHKKYKTTSPLYEQIRAKYPHW